MKFRNRREAGRVLGRRLLAYSGRADVLVLGLPRGGAPVAYEVARQLSVPWDVFLVRKLGVPGRRELAMGAIASGGVRVLNEDIVEHLRIPPATVRRVAAAEQRELERREEAYRDGRPRQSAEGKTVILVDDGLATGASMRAAVQALRARAPARVVVAVPVGAADACRLLYACADDVVCAMRPRDFYAVGNWYDDFSQTTDAEVTRLLA